MRRAAAISAGAHARAMRFCAEAFAPRSAGRHSPNTRSRPSCCTSSAATAPTARPTARSSPPARNACVLHYVPSRTELQRRPALPDRRRLRARRLRQRRHPHLPRRRPLQRRRSASSTTSSRRRRSRPSPPPGPGARQRDAHAAAVRVLAQGMLDTGLLDRAKVGDLDAVIESAAYRKFYMHGTGHWLGRDVHDVGDYQLGRRGAGRAARLASAAPWSKKPSRKLEPGMVVTIEPGLYVRAGRGRARALLGHRHPDRGRRRRHRRRLRADQPRRAGRGRRDRSADARLSRRAERAAPAA